MTQKIFDRLYKHGAFEFVEMLRIPVSARAEIKDHPNYSPGELHKVTQTDPGYAYLFRLRRTPIGGIWESSGPSLKIQDAQS